MYLVELENQNSRVLKILKFSDLKIQIQFSVRFEYLCDLALYTNTSAITDDLMIM